MKNAKNWTVGLLALAVLGLAGCSSDGKWSLGTALVGGETLVAHEQRLAREAREGK